MGMAKSKVEDGGPVSATDHLSSILDRHAKRKTQQGTANHALRSSASLTQSQPTDHLLVPGAILPRQVLQQLIAPADQLQEPTPRRMVLLVRIKMLAQIIDPLGQQGDLHLRRTGIFRVGLVIGND